MPFARTIKLHRSLSFRLTLWYGIVFSLSSCLAFLFFYVLITTNLRQRLDDRLSDKISEFEAIYNLQGIEDVKSARQPVRKRSSSACCMPVVWLFLHPT